MTTRALRKALSPLNVVYHAAVGIRNAAYDSGIFRSRRLPVPVISVGNISVGGSGKTPFTMYLVEKLLSMGKRPAVLSRGYKRLGNDLAISYPDGGIEADVRSLGDEPSLITFVFPGVPVGVFKDRYESGKVLIEKYDVDLLILDDGFQDRSLSRDVDFVLMTCDLGDLKEKYLPGGDLRDSRGRLKQADVIVLTEHGGLNDRYPDTAGVKNYSDSPVVGISFVPESFSDQSGTAHPLEEFKGRDVVAFAGIARPHSFFETLKALGIRLNRTKVFADHHWYDDYDLDEIFGGEDEIIAVTSYKDAVRIYLDNELTDRDEVKRIFALKEKASVKFGEETIDGVLKAVLGEVYA